MSKTKSGLRENIHYKSFQNRERKMNLWIYHIEEKERMFDKKLP